MTVCTDVYVRPQTCDQIWIYPSQVHSFIPPTPSGSGGGHPWQEVLYEDKYREYPRRPRNTDEEELAVLIALGLI